VPGTGDENPPQDARGAAFLRKNSKKHP